MNKEQELVKKFYDKFQYPLLLEKFEFIPADIADFFLTARRNEIEGIIKEIEEKYGKKGSMNGSLGYQGIVAGIKAYQLQEDIMRDEIINLLKAKI